jgi:hypothetical protein
MRTGILIVALAFLLYDLAGNRTSARASAPATPIATQFAPLPSSLAAHTAPTISPARVDFDSQIKPIFQSKCMPCHFNSGTMYERLPFDRPETIRNLGTKLFTRIKDENHRRLIREFLEQQP